MNGNSFLGGHHACHGEDVVVEVVPGVKEVGVDAEAHAEAEDAHDVDGLHIRRVSDISQLSPQKDRVSDSVTAQSTSTGVGQVLTGVGWGCQPVSREMSVSA